MTQPISTRKILFRYRTDPGKEVAVAGAFNKWDPKRHILIERADGLYQLEVAIPPGRYEYKMVVNGIWTIDPECPVWIPNGLGSLNSVLVVEE